MQKPAHGMGETKHFFDAVVKEFLDRDGLIQTPEADQDPRNGEFLPEVFLNLLSNEGRRRRLGENALEVTARNRGATDKTIAELRPLHE
ncbi:MAG: hypothetical protein ACJ72Z_03240 [Pyrinomonadaceae bacterium]